MDKTTPNTAYQKMLDEAPKRRAKAVEMHEQGKTMDEIGKALGISRQRASQIIQAEKQAR